MAVYIGHASIDENGNAKGGKAGDNNGKEVCIRKWYSKPWDIMIRCKDPIKAELMARACEQGCNNNHIGYDQNQRNTLRTQAINSGYDLSRITIDCETDCSAFMSVCAECAGIKIPYNSGNAPTTRTMRSAFYSTGLFTINVDSKYLTTDQYLKRGDILVKEGSHTVMVLEDGNSNVQTTSNQYYPKYVGNSNSIVEALGSVGEKDTSKAHRYEIAKANGINGYVGSAVENTQLLALLKCGMLKKA